MHNKVLFDLADMDFVWSHNLKKKPEGIPRQGVHHYLTSDAHVLWTAQVSTVLLCWGKALKLHNYLLFQHVDFFK